MAFKRELDVRKLGGKIGPFLMMHIQAPKEGIKKIRKEKGIHSTNPVLSSHFYGICRFSRKDALFP